MADKPKVMCSGDPTHLVGDAEIGSECPRCKAPVVEQTALALLMHGIKKTALENAPRSAGKEKAFDVTVVLCPGCGMPIWRSTAPLKGEDATNGVIVDVITQREGILCRSCEAIQFRYPELFAWVSNTHHWRNHRDEVLEQFQEEAMKRMRPARIPGPPPGSPSPSSPPPAPAKGKKNKKATKK